MTLYLTLRIRERVRVGACVKVRARVDYGLLPTITFGGIMIDELYYTFFSIKNTLLVFFKPASKMPKS